LGLLAAGDYLGKNSEAKIVTRGLRGESFEERVLRKELRRESCGEKVLRKKLRGEDQELETGLIHQGKYYLEG
jgi:hypothetical protein